MCDFYITDQQTVLFGLPDTENLKIITIHANPEDGIEPNNQYQDGVMYDGKIDQCETDLHDKTDNKLDKYDKKLSKLDYFLDGPTNHKDMQKSAEIAEQMKKKYPKVFSGGVRCFKGTVHIDIQKDAQPYQAPPRHVPIALQKPFKKELDCMVKNGITEPLKINEHSE